MACRDGVHPPICRWESSVFLQLVAIHRKCLQRALAILGTADTIVNKTEKVTASACGGRQMVNKQFCNILSAIKQNKSRVRRWRGVGQRCYFSRKRGRASLSKEHITKDLKRESELSKCLEKEHSRWGA